MAGKRKERGDAWECCYCHRHLKATEFVTTGGRPTIKCRDCVRFLSTCHRIELRHGNPPDTSGMYQAGAWALNVQRWSDTDRDSDPFEA